MMYLEVADIINIISIFINIAILFLVAIFFQNIQINSRTLKDYYIKEYDFQIKFLFGTLMAVENGALYPQKFRGEYFNHVSAFNNLRTALCAQYNIEIYEVISIILAIQETVEDDENFTTNFGTNTEIVLEQDTIETIKNIRTDDLEKYLYDIVNQINNKKTNIFKSLFK